MGIFFTKDSLVYLGKTMDIRPAQFFSGKVPQTLQWSLGQNSTACQFFFTFGHYLTTPLELQNFALSVEIGLKTQILE